MKKTLNKVFSALLSGENVDKKERERQTHISFVNKYCKKYKDITFKAEQNFSYFKSFLSNKKINFAKAAAKAARRIKSVVGSAINAVKRRRSGRTKVNVEANIAKNNNRLIHLQEHQTNMMTVLQQIKVAKARFKTDYNAIITDPENHTFGTPDEKNDFKQRVTDINVMVNNFMGELGKEENKKWVAAGGAIIPIAQTNESDDLIKYRAYYTYNLSNHAVGVGDKYVEACEKIKHAVSLNIQIDTLLTETTGGMAYIEHWSSEEIGGVLPLSRLWCSIEQCEKAFQFLSASGFASDADDLRKLCNAYNKNFSNLKTLQQEFLIIIYNDEESFNGRQEERRQNDKRVAVDRVLNSVKNGKEQQLYFEQSYNMDEDAVIELNGDNKIKLDIFSFMCDIVLHEGPDNLSVAELFKRPDSRCAVPAYLLGEAPRTKRRRKHPHLEWIPAQQQGGKPTICTLYDTSLLEKEREQVKYVFEQLNQKVKQIKDENKEEERLLEEKYAIKNLDDVLANVYVNQVLSKNKVAALKRWKAGEVVPGVIHGDPRKKSINKSLFPELYNFEKGCHHTDSAESVEDSEDSGSGGSSPEDIVMGEGDDAKKGDGSGSGSDSLPDIVIGGKRTRRKRRRKKKTRRRKKRRKKTKRRRRRKRRTRKRKGGMKKFSKEKKEERDKDPERAKRWEEARKRLLRVSPIVTETRVNLTSQIQEADKKITKIEKKQKIPNTSPIMFGELKQ